MKIVIVGAGMVGRSLAEHLSRQDNLVSIIDHSSAICTELNTRLDVYTVTGSGTEPHVLESAGIRNADMVIAVTPNDDTNLVICNFAKQMGVSKRIARIKSLVYADMDSPISLSRLGVTHVIEPEREVVRNIIKYIELPGVTEAASFQSGTIYLRGYRIREDMPIANKTLLECRELCDNVHILVVLIIRNGKNIIPGGTVKIIPGDEIIAIMPCSGLPAFRRMINLPAGKLKKIIVSGDSLTAVQLAQELTGYADRVLLIDPDSHHGKEAAAFLKDVEVLHGDCTRLEMLQEVHVETAPFFIAAGRDTEDNIMSCLLAKAEGTREVIAVSTNRRHAEMFVSLGINRIINPHDVTFQTIIANIIKVPVGALLKLKNVNVHVSRYVAGKNSRITGKPIREQDEMFNHSIVFGYISRGDDVIIPSGETIVREHDEVLVLSQPKDLGLVTKLFKSRLLPAG